MEGSSWSSGLVSQTGRDSYFRTDGRVKMIGECVEHPDLAHTLSMIGREGADVFYRGEIADLIDADFSANGGLLRKQISKLIKQPAVPLFGSYRDVDIVSNHPPGGGLMLLQMLNILENFDLKAIGHNDEDTAWLRRQ